MKELNRTKVGIFDIKDSISVEEFEENKSNETYLRQHIISIEELFVKLYGKDNIIKLNDKKLELFLNGVKLTYELNEGLYRIYDSKKDFIGVGSIQNNLLKKEIC